MSARSSIRIEGLAWLLAGALGCSAGGEDAGTEILVAAASSLRNVMPELVTAYRDGGRGPELVVTYAGSGMLRQQVESGAPIDAVVLAGASPVDQLIASGRADGATRRVIATNELVLIGPAGSAPLSFEQLGRLPAGEHLAVGHPDSVPVGRYARQLLRGLGIWSELEDRLVYAANVATVLAFARRGEVRAAVVYRTDTLGLDDIVLLDVACGEGAPRAEVVATVTRGGSGRAGAGSFVRFLSSPQARAILERHGFRPA